MEDARKTQAAVWRDMIWQRVSLLCDRDLVDSVCDELDTAGAVATSFEDGAQQPVYEPAPGETALWSTVRVSALMNSAAPVASLRERLGQVLGRDCALRVEPLPDRDWKAAWRERFGRMQFGHRLWVAPPGEHPSAPGKHVATVSIVERRERSRRAERHVLGTERHRTHAREPRKPPRLR